MTLPVVEVRQVPTVPTCRRCHHPIRLRASITAGECCCCRKRCGLEHGYGCFACGALLPDCDADIGLCAGCRMGVA